MSTLDEEELEGALRELAYTSLNLDTELDRIRLSEWLRKLINIPSTNLETNKLKNDYIQYLKIILRSGMLHGIFRKLPPQGDLKPLSEVLGQEIVKSIPELPQMGPIAPYMKYQSENGKAYISIKKIQDKGMFCYMAVTPDNLNNK